VSETEKSFVEVEVGIGPWLRGALLDAGFKPDDVLVAPVHTWFPFSSPDAVRIQFEVEPAPQQPMSEESGE
jgi:hypothetical protein